MKRIIVSMMVVCMLFLQIPASAFAADSNDNTTITVENDAGELIEVELSMSEEQVTIQQNREGYYNLHEIWVKAPGAAIERLDIDWSCDDTKVVELSDGQTHGSVEFSPVGVGQAVIKAVCNGEVVLYCHVTVVPAEPVDDRIPITMYQGCSVYFYDYHGGFESLIETYTSDNESVAIVDKSGRITAVGEGEANITLATDSYESDTFAITVKKAIVAGETKLYWGESSTFSWDGFGEETPISYHVFGKPAVTVDESGVFTGIASGECAVVAEAEGYDPVLILVTVIRNEIKVKKTSVKIYTGETVQLNATVSPEDIPIVFSSDNEAIAAVDESGTITGVGSGLATITLVTKGARPVEVTVRVVKDKLDTPKLKLTHDGDGINLSWGKVPYAESYKIYRKIEGGKWKQIASKDSKTRTYVDTKISLDQNYSYKVKATDVSYGMYRESEYSNVVSQEITKLKAPVTVKAENTGYKSVKLTWSRVYPASGYEIYRSKSGKNGTFVKVKTIEKPYTLSYNQTGLTPGQKYYYKVRAIFAADSTTRKSTFSAVKSVAPNLSKPEMKKISYTTSSTIKVSWNKVSYAHGYYVYRKTTDGSWKKVGTVKNNTTLSFKDDAPAGAYLYSVKAYRTVEGKKVFSVRSKSIKTRTLKAPKVTVEPANSTDFRAKVTWTKVTGATGYKVYRCNTGGSWKCVKTVGSSTRKYTASVPHGNTVKWKVRAIYEKDEGTAYGAYSKVVPIQLSYIPSYIVDMSEKSKTSVRYITITVRNNGPEFMYIEPDAAIKDADNEKYDRELVLYNKEAGVEQLGGLIRPRSSCTLTYKVIGDKTRYTKKTMLAFMFRYDNVDYVGVSTAKNGDICIDIETYMEQYQ